MECGKLRSVSHINTNTLIINDAIWSDIVTTACTCKSKADLGRREEKFLDPRMIAYIKRHLVHCPLAIITVFKCYVPCPSNNSSLYVFYKISSYSL